MAKMLSVNHETLKLARQNYALSLQEVSIKTKINMTALEQYEAGNDFPTYSQLERLSNYYNKPMFYFFTKGMDVYDMEDVAFRDNGSETSRKRIMELIESANVYKLNLEELYEGEKKKSFMI